MIALLRSPSVVTAAAIAALGSLFFLAALVWPAPAQEAADQRSMAVSEAGQPAVGPVTADPSLHAAILERPLFEPERQRRPPPPPEQEVARQVVEPPPLSRLDGYRVVGLVVAGSSSLALVERPGGGEALRIARGDLVEGWIADAVSDRGIEFVQRGERLVLGIPKHDEAQRQSASAGGAP